MIIFFDVGDDISSQQLERNKLGAGYFKPQSGLNQIN